MSSSSTPPPPPPPTDPTTAPKKPPPLPWTHQETISVIESYRDKWYSVNRGHLKSAQWDQVAESVPSKTPIQCRHKIEKLRKRYRSELHKPFPYNTWQYFQIMHQMEQGPLNPTPISALPRRDPPNNNTYYHHRDSEDDDDEEDEEWSGSKTRSVKNMAAGTRNLRDRKRRKSFYNNEAAPPDDDDDDDDESSDDDDEDEEDVGGTNRYTSRNKYDGDGDEEVVEEMGLGREIMGFAERFVRMENEKIEMMRDTERLRMEMERKKMDMIAHSQRKIVHTINQVFGTTTTTTTT